MFATGREVSVRLIMLYFASVAMTLALSASMIVQPADASDPGIGNKSLPTHHYSDDSQAANTVVEYPDGTEIIPQRRSGASQGDVQLLAAADWVPFNWTINFDSTLRGRDMKSSNGVFCQRFRATYRQTTAMDYIRITLVRNRSGLPDVRYATKNFRADGTWSLRKCWDQHDASATYHFDYAVEEGMVGYDVRGEGYASN